MKEYLTSIRVGYFLASREIRNSNKWNTGLVIFIMCLTFINLIVIRGVLVGLVEGVVAGNKTYSSGDLYISNLDENETIERGTYVLEMLEGFDSVDVASPRYVGNVVLEANYKTKVKESDEADTAGGFAMGIYPETEESFSGLSDLVVAGEYLKPNAVDEVMVGSSLLEEYSVTGEGLADVEIGDKVRMKVAGVTREVTVVGIIDSKIEIVSGSVFIPAQQLRQMMGRNDYGFSEIAVKLKPGADPKQVKTTLLANGIDRLAKVETFEEAQPAFVKDISGTMALLGNIVGGIGLAVASITTFIIIFVNAITQRTFIGIMKGIGIHWFAIVSSYMMQALFYATLGSALALVLIYGFMVPYFSANPIDFPFSDGILAVSNQSTGSRLLLLFGATLIAGFVPARMIVKKNTLDSILGR